ncbi:MAG: DEAD/DEAH box helicase [Vigna little leaf phytoplasma]|nr:DEAD/DEAH box helicase [Vigna little leaf phytoplasma]
MSILFKQFNLLEQIEKALEDLNFANPTPIQALVIPEMIAGHDIIAQSQTGTGKTFAFSIPIISKIDHKKSQIQSLILCPTRELALQVFNEIKKLLKFYKEIRIAVIYGGESYVKQFQILETKPHIIIATPGRIIDLLERKKIDLSAVSVLTLDEADEMLKMGFQEALETILRNIPSNRQTVLFSATLPLTIKKIASKYQKDPKILKVQQENLTVKTIEQYYFLIREFDKNKLLVRLLDQKNPDSLIIFANTKRDVDNIFSYLQERDFLVDALHGDLKQNQRQYVMNNFRKNNIKILVATDVAARGLDISDVKIIINYDLPHEHEVYVHRIGRTGRAGKTGIAYSFIGMKKISQLKQLERYLKEKITHLPIPTIEEVNKAKEHFFQQKIINLINKPTKENNNEAEKTNTFTEALLRKFEASVIINGLLQNLMPKQIKYEHIEEVKNWGGNRLTSSYEKRNNYSSRFVPKNNYSYNKFNNRTMTELTINLGREDGINPSLLLKILNDKFNIYSRNIGNIKHFYNKTVFEITDNLVPQIKSKNNIYFEQKLLQISIK